MISGPQNSQDEIGLILHVCLELIERGEESIESLTIRYPETKDFLRPPLRRLGVNEQGLILPAFLISSRLRLVSTVQWKLILLSSRISQISSYPTN
jgi:hypothetical protein